jgi:cytochrome c5
MVCHRDGVAGAPKFRNAEEWGLRSSKKNIEALTASAIKGLNAMPAKGTCQDCSDADIKAAIQYMVPQ